MIWDIGNEGSWSWVCVANDMSLSIVIFVCVYDVFSTCEYD